MEEDIVIRKMALAELHSDALSKFNRYQETHRVKYVMDGQYLFKEDYFIDYWDDDKKAEVIQSLQRCVQGGGVVVGAIKGHDLVGFANIESNTFGRSNNYLELAFLHVSNEYRGQGIGKILFQLCCDAAKQRGARQLYISAHPAQETQMFYMALGCGPATEINHEILAREPLDIQLEFVL